MFKIIVLFSLLTICYARPSYLHSPTLGYDAIYAPTIDLTPTYHIEQPAYTIGHSYHAIPTAISHQSSTIYHTPRLHHHSYPSIVSYGAPSYNAYNAYLPTSSGIYGEAYPWIK